MQINEMQMQKVNKEIVDFITESNSIERIFRDPTQAEIDELIRFMALPVVTIEELEKFIEVYQPGAMLRDKHGLNVRVGNYIPPLGSTDIRIKLEDILRRANFLSAYHTHIYYEKLHPFTDGNGRSGRALWAWRKKNLEGGFLLNFYYETLQMN